MMRSLNHIHRSLFLDVVLGLLARKALHPLQEAIFDLLFLKQNELIYPPMFRFHMLEFGMLVLAVLT